MARSTAGGAYTFLNTKSGTEFSAMLGFTCNFENPRRITPTGSTLTSTSVWRSSSTSNSSLPPSPTSYVYQQLTPDSGQRAILGSNESRTRGVGPPVGYNLNINGTTVYTNRRAYWEFDSYRRLQGHAIYATLNIPLSGLFTGNRYPKERRASLLAES